MRFISTLFMGQHMRCWYFGRRGMNIFEYDFKTTVDPQYPLNWKQGARLLWNYRLISLQFNRHCVLLRGGGTIIPSECIHRAISLGSNYNLYRFIVHTNSDCDFQNLLYSVDINKL